MPKSVILLSIPGLRERDVAVMPHLCEATAGGEIAELVPSFPSVTCPVQANMTTGKLPQSHGVVANGFYFRDGDRLEMWTSPNDCIQAPQIWDVLAGRDPKLASAVWFPLHSKQCRADYVCTPAPIHNPDGSESLWCYTRPPELYGTLRDELGHFPLKHFWGPMAGIPSSRWIADSAVSAARKWRPGFFYIYLPHLDYAAQRNGPDGAAADQAVAELDEVLGKLTAAFHEAYAGELIWIIAGEYAITPVRHVAYPNRVLRDAGLLAVKQSDHGELLDTAASKAWALADHQHSHVFVAGGDSRLATRVAELFRAEEGIAAALLREDLGRCGLDHPLSGDVVLVSSPGSWQAYYYWLDDAQAPQFARTVDIHRKPGYDPVELCFDPATGSIPLDAALIQGSHGAPAVDRRQTTVILSTHPGMFPAGAVRDVDVFGVVMRHLGIDAA